MELRKEDAQVPSSLNDFLNERLLVLEIGLEIQDVPCAALSSASFAFTSGAILHPFTLHYQPIFPQASLKENLFHPLQLAREFGVIHGKAHWL